jgi:DNA-binding MarR family transcriptional regulator
MKTLADEIAESLTAEAITLAVIASRLGADLPSVRRAAQALNDAGRALLIRRRRVLHLASTAYPGRICIICYVEFEPVRKQTRTCSHSCARYLAWQNDDMRSRHRASIIAAKADPASRAHLSEINKARCSTPEARRLQSERNCRSWQDPEIRTRRVIAMEAAWHGEQAMGRIEKARSKKLDLWSDADWRQRTCEAMRTGRRGRFKRAVIAMILGYPEIEASEIAPRVGLTIKQVKAIWRGAVRLGEVERKPPDGRSGRGSQAHHHVRKRVAATMASKKRNKAIKDQQPHS